MSKGLLYIVFGKEYDELAAHTVAYSRQYTNLPICILTNIANRNKIWEKITNVSFIEFDLTNNENRNIKTQMVDYTPFDTTLYLDCDSVVQRDGIEDIFNTFNGSDLILNLFLRWSKTNLILRIYKDIMKKCGEVLPLDVYNGAFICFKKNYKVNRFFETWNLFWKLSDRGREMPALACAVKQSQIKVTRLPKNYFSPDIPMVECVVQHNYNSYKGKDFFKEFGLPRIKENKSFDKNPKDWNWVDFEE